MTEPIRMLENSIQRYAWGSTTAIQRLLGTEPDGTPAAELWLGAHPSAPSRVADAGTGGGPDTDAGATLEELLRSDPDGMLGTRITETFGPRLPYLFKVLAADHALSLQVHPRPHQARAGFNRDNRRGVPIGSPERTFSDDQHKPEMVVAISQFEALIGVRNPRTVLNLLDGLDGALVARVRDILAEDRSPAAIGRAFGLLVVARHDPSTAADIELTAASLRGRAAGTAFARADATALALIEQYPGDPGALASLLLNRVTLEPGEAAYVPSGQLHAYLSGTALEIMASSDNVLRAGLTSKRIDEEALLRCASFVPSPPERPTIRRAGRRGQVQTYRVPEEEFALTMADVDPAEPVRLAAAGPRIVLCLDGAAELTTPADRVPLGRGQSAFVPDAAGPMRVAGSAHVACAWVP